MTPQTIDIETFVEVAEKRSFGRAASSMLVSQPAVSDRIARLERAVGATLFSRHTRGSVLTHAGERYLPYAQRLLELMAEADRVARSAERPRQLRIGVHSTFARQAIALVLDALAGQQWSLTVRDAHSDAIIEMLLDRVVDLGFVLAGARPPQLGFVALKDDPVVCISAPDHPLAGRSRVLYGRLASHPVAFNRWGSGSSSALSSLEDQGLPVWSWTECPDAMTALYLARQRGYLSFIASSFVADELRDGTVAKVRLQPTLAWSVQLTAAYMASEASEDGVRDVIRELSPPNEGHRGGREAVSS